jgi:hypothetical protein
MFTYSNCIKAEPLPIENDTIDVNILKRNAIKDIDLDKLKIIKDTLWITSTSDFLYFPFGLFKSISEFKKRFKLAWKQNIEEDRSDEIPRYNYKVYKMIFKNSFVKLFKDDEKNEVEIVSGKIINPELLLTNQIKIGIDKKVFLLKFFNKTPETILDKINVVKLESGLLGMWHYYKFKDNILQEIIFKTDYLFNQN